MPVSGSTQTVLSWALKIEGAREEVRFVDHFGNDTRLISVEGEPRTIAIEASGEVETYNKAGVIGIHRGFAPLWLILGGCAGFVALAGLLLPGRLRRAPLLAPLPAE